MKSNRKCWLCGILLGVVGITGLYAIQENVEATTPILTAAGEESAASCALKGIRGCPAPQNRDLLGLDDLGPRVKGGYGIYETMHKQKITRPAAQIDYPYLAGAYLGESILEMEPEEDEFYFAELDNLIEIWQEKGKKIIVGFPINPGGPITFLPDWLLEKIDYIEVVKQGVITKHAILWDPIFLQEYEEFVSKIAERYDGNEGIEFIIIGTGVYMTTAVNFRRALIDPEICQKYEEFGYSDQLWYETILRIVEINKRYFKKTPLALGLNHFYIGLSPEEVCLPNKNPEYNYLRLAREVADQGVYVFIHHLSGDERWLANEEELEMLSEVSKRTKVVLGLDNPTTIKHECGSYRFGEPEKIIDYAFGGVDGIPEIDTSYISFYEQDLDAAEDGKIGEHFVCDEWIEKFKNAFEKAYARWEHRIYLPFVLKNSSP